MKDRLRPVALSRRGVLTGMGAGLVSLGVCAPARAAADRRRLVAEPGRQALGLGSESRLVDTWSYNGAVPGPLLRYRVGDRLEVDFTNRLAEPTSVHWHGLRLPNTMDGAAPLTQAPVAPGASTTYAFDLRDAGTYWYHTHFRGWNQQDRGLYGILVVDEAEPPAIDRELVLVLDDWVLTSAGALDTDFGALHEWAHAGRLGNLATINNTVDAPIALTAGERVRLRLANVANAQVFALLFEGHDPVVIAEDGNPVPPRTLGGDVLLLGPGQRVDVVLDAVGDPGSSHPIRAFTLLEEITLGRLVYGAGRGGSGLLGAPVAPLPDNPRPTLDLEGARRLTLRMEGGAMSRMTGAMLDGRMLGMRELVENRRVWAFNGVAGDMANPLATLKRGETAIVELVNATAFPHAMHLHGMHFREVARNGTPVDGAWRDTTILAPDERVAIAFAAEAPGKWMLHCHMIEHQAAGMMTYVEIEGDAA